jgi:hypothetical protein
VAEYPLHEQCQLAAKEEILGVDRLGRAEQEHHPPEGVLDQTTCDLGEVILDNTVSPVEMRQAPRAL